MSFPIKKTVRELRKNQTFAEALLWKELRNRQLDGYRFVRQFPITYVFEGRSRLFIADFYCAQHKFIIELDGNSHTDKQEHDLFRDLVMTQQQITVFRAPNAQAIDHMPKLLGIIKKTILKLPSFEKRGAGGEC
jgi:very-short-patch-repair endonuclease